MLVQRKHDGHGRSSSTASLLFLWPVSANCQILRVAALHKAAQSITEKVRRLGIYCRGDQKPRSWHSRPPFGLSVCLKLRKQAALSKNIRDKALYCNYPQRSRIRYCWYTSVAFNFSPKPFTPSPRLVLLELRPADAWTRPGPASAAS